MPSLFVVRGNDQGTRFTLEAELIRLGRDAGNHVQLHDSEVSRRHAELHRADDGYTLHDLNSSNGTYVNGVRVEHQALRTGDRVQCGGTQLLFTAPAPEHEASLGAMVDIAELPAAIDRSRIVRSMAQVEGSRILDPATELPRDSWLARARGGLQVMYGTALAVSRTLDIDQLLQRIMELIFQWVEADRGCVMLIDPQSRRLSPAVHRRRDGKKDDDRLTISKTILDYVIDRKEGVLTSDARQDERWEAGASIMQAGVREAICVPLQGRYDLVGAIYIDTTAKPSPNPGAAGPCKFTEDHLKLMIAIGHQAALAVEDTRYYSAMVQAERLAAIGQTVAILSHHIKNILQGLRGGGYLIASGLERHDEGIVSQGWKIVEKNQNKISSLVLDMLTFSKEREPDLMPADVNETVGDVVELAHAQAGESGVALVWQTAADLPKLVFDPEGLHRAVLNVVSNAIDAAAETEAGGRVVVRVEYAFGDGSVRIVVDDNGPGIPDDQLSNIFSPFVSTKKSRGTGLGLPVSQKILVEHGGRITVENLPGGGSRFRLELPAVLPSSLPAATQMLPPTPQ